MSHENCNHPIDQKLRRAALEGCEESRLLVSRRAMMGVTASLFSWSFMPRWAEAATADDPRLLVVILRGGMDGINVCIPYRDPAYVKMRGDIAIPKSSAIALAGPSGSDFCLNPALKNFGAMFNAKEAAFVHACCVPLRTRSHFDCQDNLENGYGGGAPVANATGWLNRLLSALPAGSPIKAHGAGAIEIGEAPLILRGDAPVLGWSPTWFDKVDGTLLQSVRSLYKKRDPEMSSNLEAGLAADRLATRYAGNSGNVSSLRQAFRGAGALIAAANGPRIAVLSVDGFDTHSDQGVTQGYLADVLAELDLAIADFKAVVGASWPKTAMVLATEFGRTVHVNGDHGTDHGVGTTVMLAGGAINGGHVFGDWPGIDQKHLYEDSDLKPTTDARSVFKGLLRDHLGVAGTTLNNKIFPDSGAVPITKGLIKTSTRAAVADANTNIPLRDESPIARYRRGQKVTQEKYAQPNFI